jgi:hypothetical protein
MDGAILTRSILRIEENSFIGLINSVIRIPPHCQSGRARLVEVESRENLANQTESQKSKTGTVREAIFGENQNAALARLRQ